MRIGGLENGMVSNWASDWTVQLWLAIPSRRSKIQDSILLLCFRWAEIRATRTRIWIIYMWIGIALKNWIWMTLIELVLRHWNRCIEKRTLHSPIAIWIDHSLELKPNLKLKFEWWNVFLKTIFAPQWESSCVYVHIPFSKYKFSSSRCKFILRVRHLGTLGCHKTLKECSG